MDSAGKRPRRLRAKYTPRTNLAICTRGISLLRRACVSVLALTDRGAAGNRPALSGVVPPLRRRDNIRGDERRKNGGERWHSFIQMSKLSNVKGRISYISDPKRQEYLYATFSTREDMTFWNDLAKECQEEFKRFGTEGKCIEARELI